MSKEKWTTDNINNLNGRIIIVTGGNSGLGYESVKAFAMKGAEVILACRDTEKGEEAKRQIGKTHGKIVVMELDLADFSSIRKFAADFQKKYNKLDVLLNNAGIMTSPYFKTKDGLEAQNGINHFGHFLLTGLLLPIIKKTPGSRIINVSSLAHKWGKMDFNDPFFENGNKYSPMKSYGSSKLSNLLFTYELHRRFERNNIDSIAVAAHPGGARTNLGRYVEGKWWFKILSPLFMLMTQEQDKGALPQIRASVDESVKGGAYYGPGGFREQKGFPVRVDSNDLSKNREDAEKLWKLSEEVTGIQFGLN